MTKGAYRRSMTIWPTNVGCLRDRILITGTGRENGEQETEKEGADMNDRITESEWALMEILWQGEMTQPQLAQRLGRKWSKNTVHTFLTRLCARGVLEVDRERSPHVYRALVSREECEREERQSFLQRVYQGNVGRMVASFVRDSQLSAGEARELRRMLEDMEE